MMNTNLSVWALGFAMGIHDRLVLTRSSNETFFPHIAEAVRADELISIYKRGVKDALKTNPVSLSLNKPALKSGPVNNLWRHNEHSR
jgi:hypothetical protein